MNDLSRSRRMWAQVEAFFRFVTNHAFDRQTDGQNTEGNLSRD